MADITMCTNELCPIAGECHRMQAEPHEYRQAYQCFPYVVTPKGVECDHYVPHYIYTATDNTK